jgi:hypothetical protein
LELRRGTAFISSIAPAFYFASWFTGQFVRISRQTEQEVSFDTLKSQLSGVAATMSNLTSSAQSALAIPQIPQSVAEDLRQSTASANTIGSGEQHRCGDGLTGGFTVARRVVPTAVAKNAASGHPGRWIELAASGP